MERCFALGNYGGCYAVEKQYFCNGQYETCPFYKTELKQARQHHSAFERIKDLPADIQKRIAEQYYGGREPWKYESIE